MSDQTVGIVGLGLMGRGIAACLLSREVRVVAYERDDQIRLDAKKHIALAIDQMIERKAISDAGAQWRQRLIDAKTISQLADCTFVIESVVEDLAIKNRVFDEIEAAVGASAPIASNTSALPITLLQKGRKNPQRFIGMHWAEPCHLTRFLEIVRGDETDDATAEAAMSLARLAGKDPALLKKDVEGFIANRLGYAMYREAFWLLESGVGDVETIDRAFHNAMSIWGNIAGPFRWMDLTGIPAYASVMQRLWPQLSCATEVPETMRKLVASGAKGISNGRGFYNYTPEEARLWEERLTENVWKVRQMLDELFGKDQA